MKLALAIASAVAVAVVAPIRDPAATCTVITMPWIRDSGATVFIVRQSRDTVPAGVWIDRPFRLGPARQGDREDTIPLSGQLLLVDTVVGVQASVVYEAFARVGRQVVVLVPWNIGSACERHAWRSSAPFLRTGEPSLLAVKLRAHDGWVGGLPTFDSDSITELYVASQFAAAPDDPDYPYGPPMSVASYLAIYRVLPTEEAWVKNPQGEADRLSLWARRNRAAARQSPMVQSLWFMRRWLREWKEGYWRDSL